VVVLTAALARSSVAQAEPANAELDADAGSADVSVPEAPLQVAPETAAILPDPAPVVASPAPEAPPRSEPQPVEVTVRGSSAARRLEDSAQAVHVVELQQAKLESADLGSVMARAPGVSFRRVGGLGSESRFSINGMQGDQVRFFIDGVPLEYMGYAFGIANVPVNLSSRVEIYGGVVPIRFGADALGGAVNLVSEETLSKSGAGVSYQHGSFGTQRASAALRHVDRETGLFARAEAFWDASDNDYKVDVLVADNSGRESQRRVRRFHDAYDARGVAVEAGLLGKPWASRLSLRGFVSGYQKEMQSDRLMTVAFGETESQTSRAGLLLIYRNSFGDDWSLATQTGYNQLDTRFTDLASCVYNWLNECVNTRKYPGELTDYVSRNGADQRANQDHTFNRSVLSYRASDWLTLSVSLAPTFVQQSGKDVRITNPEQRDSLRDEHSLFTLVNGVEGRSDLFDNALQTIIFAKQYFQSVKTVESKPDAENRDDARSAHHVGAGALVRYQIASWLLAKASYEWATRLPESLEILGDNVSVRANLDLKPERSHNFNVEAVLRLDKTTTGSWSLSTLGFWRGLDDMILLLPYGLSRYVQYQNVYETRAIGAVADARWTSPGEYILLSGNFTSQRYVAASSGGPFGYLEGKRLPNRPSVFGNAELRFQFSEVFAPKDVVFLSNYLSWIQAFHRGWEGVGAEEFKQLVPSQLTWMIALGYRQRHSWGSLSASVEMQNLTDAAVFDYFGAQKPGRAVYAKITGELN